MRKLKTDIRVIFATIVVSSALPMAANAAAYKVTINGKSEVTCSASSSAWKLYAAAKTGISQASLERLADDSQESKRCIAERQAKLKSQTNSQSR